MKRLVCLLVGVAFLSACSHSERAIEIAEDFTKEKIIPLYPNAELTNICLTAPVERVHFIRNKDITKHRIAKEKYLLDIKDLYAQRLFRSGGSSDEFEIHKTTYGVIQSSIDAINTEAAKQGFYEVHVAIKYEGAQCESFDIILSKDFKVLNPL